MQQPFRILFLSLFVLGSNPSLTSAQEVTNPNCDVSLEVSLVTMTAKASIIVEGKAVSKRGFWNAAHTRIYTATTINVYKVFKGTLHGNQVEIVTPGGNVNELVTVAFDSNDLPVEGVGLFFGVPTQQGTQGSALPVAQVLDIFGGTQGFFSYRGEGEQYNTAVTVCRTYRDIRNTLYAPIQQALDRPYTELAAFNVDTYDVYEDLRPTPATAPQKKSTSSRIAQPNAAPVITSVSRREPNNGLTLNGAVKGGTFDRVVIQGSDLVDAGGNTTVFLANVDQLQNPALRSVVPVPTENFLTKTAALLEFYVPSNVDRQVGSISYSGVAGTGPIRVENANGSGTSPAPLNVFARNSTCLSPKTYPYRSKFTGSSATLVGR